MEEDELKLRLIYQDGVTGLTLLSHLELAGTYPIWFYDKEVNKYNSHWSFPKSEASIESYLKDIDGSRSIIAFAIYDLKDKKHIGNISIQSIDLINRSAELAFLLGDRKYWNKGHGARSAKLCLQHCFSTLNLNRVHLGCHELNKGMNALAEKLGFIKEGVRREAVFSDGQYSSIIEYGLLKSEYEKSINSCP